jgi:hypothetical protein
MNLDNICINSQATTIIEHVCHPQILENLSSNRVNADVETEIFELTKIYLHQLVKSSNKRLLSEYQLVDQAIRKTLAVFTTKLGEDSETFDSNLEKIQPYLEKVREFLIKKPSKSKKSFSSYLSTKVDQIIFERKQDFEQTDSIELIRTSDQEYEANFNRLLDYLVQAKERFKESSKSPDLVISKVGFDDFIEGLILNPIIEDLTKYSINLRDLPENFYLLENEYNTFPFEITSNKFIFILDEDGTILVYVENLPPDVLTRVGELLIDLGVHLYKRPSEGRA